MAACAARAVAAPPGRRPRPATESRLAPRSLLPTSGRSISSRRAERNGPVITHISLTDFKAFHTLRIDLKPVTVLIGENNSGKSSIIAALRLLSQTMSSFDAQVPLLLQGEFGDFGTYRDLVYGNLRSRPFRIVLKIAEPLDIESGNIWTISLEFKYRTVRRELIVREVQILGPVGDRHLITVTHSKDADRHLVTRIGGRSVPTRARARVADRLRLYHFLPTFVPARRRPTSQLHDVFDEDWLTEQVNQIEEANWDIRTSLRDIDYLGSMRLPPERTYAQTGETRSKIGPAGENWVSMLAREVAASSRTENQSHLLRQLRTWLKRAGLASDVTPRWASDRHYEIEVQHPVTGEYENLADVGQANSQVLPVLVGGYRLDEETLYLVEEPEIHLHPRAQAELGDFFLNLYAEGVWSVIETHSEYLLLRLQQHVAAGMLHPDAVAFYYVRATRRGKSIKRLRLDSHGRFTDPLPGGFFPERMEEAKRLARLRGESLVRQAKSRQ